MPGGNPGGNLGGNEGYEFLNTSSSDDFCVLGEESHPSKLGEVGSFANTVRSDDIYKLGEGSGFCNLK